MAKTIVWNNKASNQFLKIIIYLGSEWGSKVARSFIDKTLSALETLSQYSELGQVDNEVRRIRAFVMSRHNTLIYRIDNSRIYLLNIFDNRQHPKKKFDI
jgi:plasmid stabilization system protein ParE